MRYSRKHFFNQLLVGLADYSADAAHGLNCLANSPKSQMRNIRFEIRHAGFRSVLTEQERVACHCYEQDHAHKSVCGEESSVEPRQVMSFYDAVLIAEQRAREDDSDQAYPAQMRHPKECNECRKHHRMYRPRRPQRIAYA